MSATISHQKTVITLRFSGVLLHTTRHLNVTTLTITCRSILHILGGTQYCLPRAHNNVQIHPILSEAQHCLPSTLEISNHRSLQDLLYAIMVWDDDAKLLTVQ